MKESQILASINALVYESYCCKLGWHKKERHKWFWWKVVLESNHLEGQIRWDIIKLDFRGLLRQEERLYSCEKVCSGWGQCQILGKVNEYSVFRFYYHGVN